MKEAGPLLEIRTISKSFPGVKALKGVDFDLRPGEVHVLVGENGAGKSTLVKLLCGVHAPDTGEILLDGRPYLPTCALDAYSNGVRTVHQELNLLPYLSAAENIFFERLPSRFGIIDRKQLHTKALGLLSQVGLDIDPDTPVELLGVAQMQLLEIAKALASESRILILDEPTAMLTSKEIDLLFSIIRGLVTRGTAVIYISHRLSELAEIGDRITILRNGERVGTWNLEDITVPEIVKRMVGREIGEEYPFSEDPKPGDIGFKVEGIIPYGAREPISFAVRNGEILGISGLVGSGRTETLRAICGVDPSVAGRVFVNRAEHVIRCPKDAVDAGISLLTEDRKGQGLILDMPLCANITITDLRRVSRFGLMDYASERKTGEGFANDLSIRATSASQIVRNLSGGNQQKVVLAKWLFRNTKVVLLDEPTRGVDVGARREIYLILRALADDGKCVVVVSSDLPELMGICHRIIVFSNRAVSGEVARDDFCQELLLSLAYKNYIQERRNDSRYEKERP